MKLQRYVLFFVFLKSIFVFSDQKISVGSAKIQKGFFSWEEDSQKLDPELQRWKDIFKKNLKFNLEWIGDFNFQEKNTQIGSYLFEIQPSFQEEKIHWDLKVKLGEKSLLKKTYVGNKNQTLYLSNLFSNHFVEEITGTSGIFLSEIAMVCDFDQKKEIYTMRFDGSELKKITQHRSLAFSPAWSADGKKLAYSVFIKQNGIKKIQIYEIDLVLQTLRLRVPLNGINSGVAYSPNKDEMLFTSSHQGSSEIVLLDLKTGKSKPLTAGGILSVEPSWSPTGNEIVFSSSRTGAPMLFTMNREGKNQQQLTYAGKYNASPQWSPSPKDPKIVFSGWLEDHFDLYLMDPNGTHMERLTDGQGNHEDPTFSPDGQWIAFSSNRGSKLSKKESKMNIYVIHRDGTRMKRLTYGNGNCTFPRWSPNRSQ